MSNQIFDCTYMINDTQYRIIIYADTICAPFQAWSDSGYGRFPVSKSWLEVRLKEKRTKFHGAAWDRKNLIRCIMQAQKENSK